MSETREAWTFPVRNRSLLLTRGRRRAMPPTKTLRALGLGRGMTFLDVGCGPGYFSIPACRIVGKQGRVLACDVSPVMVRELRALAKERGCANLTAVRSASPQVPFPDRCADFALIAFVVHALESAEPLLRETRRAMKEGATLVLVEWHKKPMDMGPPLRARFRPGELVALLRETSFREAGWSDFDGNTYFATARADWRAPGAG